MKTQKLDWTCPSLATYGDIEQVTAVSIGGKNFDGDDGFTLEGDSIGC